MIPVRLLSAAAICVVLLTGAGGSSNTAFSAGAVTTLPQCAGVSAGTAYHYDIDGGITAVQPPTDFTPLTATDAQLLCYGFPTRPTTVKGLASWQNEMAHATHWVAPGFGALGTPTLPITGTVAKSHDTHYSPPNDYPWSGYAIPASLNTGWTNLKWNEVVGDWTVPYGHTYCYSGLSGASDSPWLGIGGNGWDGGNLNALIQAGTNTIDQAGRAYTGFYWEDFNNNPYPVSYPSVSAGDSVYVDVHYLGNLTTTFFYQNFSTGNYTSFNKGTRLVDQSSAEFINEDQPASWDFANFGSVPFSSVAALGTWGSSGQYSIQKYLSDTVNLAKFTAYENGGDTSAQLVAYPSAVDGSGNFTDYATANDGC